MIELFRWYHDRHNGRGLGFIMPVTLKKIVYGQAMCIVFSERGSLGSKRKSPFGVMYVKTIEDAEVVKVEDYPHLLYAIGRWGRQAIQEVFEEEWGWS